jgi:hypothetical protein
MKLLKEVYKTYEGARKRAAFENGVARGEYERGYKAKHYRYAVIQETDYHSGKPVWRVKREVQS